MTINDLLVDQLEQNLGMVQMTLADFSDADMMVRPAPNANHAMWQLGHLCRAEVNLMNLVKPGSMPELPAGFADKFDKVAATNDDPKAFVSKQELLSTFAKIRQATINVAKSISASDLNNPMPEKMQRLAKDAGNMLAMQVGHVAMHVGQFQVTRRKLGKPVLF
jgi:hypothetical protein